MALKGPADVSGVAVLLNARPLAAGEEITISYIDEEQPYMQRALALQDYGFVCACERCRADRAALGIAD